MRMIVLEICIVTASLLFLVTMAAVARHRARSGAERGRKLAGLFEYVWSAVPWLMVFASALPAVKEAVTGN